MFNVLIDTCVWLDLADKPQQTPLLEPLEGLLSYAGINLLVPQIVLDEFKRNRARVSERSTKGLTTHFNQVKDAIRRAGGPKRQKDRVLQYLSDIDHRLPEVGGSAKATLDRIQGILEKSEPFETSDAAKLKAFDRALARKGPCHNNKNSVADAMIIETYFECVRAGKGRDRFAFVTHNKSDFSLVGGDDKLPHADIASGFSKIKSLYFTNLGACLMRVEPSFVREILTMGSFEEEPRTFSELISAVDTLTKQVWYNRHKNREFEIEEGTLKVVPREQWEKTTGYNHHEIVDTIWAGALKAAKRTERELGEGNYGPWDDFEWGMINGKLSALRWALGDEWDMLDT